MGRLEVKTFQSCYTNLLKMNATNHELVSVSKNGTPGMNGENVGLT
jgi:hypothetical protein